ncbi:uncharacterized protein LOC120537906 isoform X1 [Polypterus senegalus]|uniref:uncharacterized protein LOC120537906 isoform X1 n=1 Tax=Polypterus senegalus TaxID=55291 RepID=UPI0019651416|nr:uncharacterized protein LOC120537906 isoform X1 [Polypterus senegalus]
MHALYDTAGTFLAALTRHTEVPEVQEPQSSLVADLVFLESAPVNVLLVAGVTCVVWRFCARKKAAARQARFTGDICELAYRRLWLKQGEATEALGIGDERCAKTMSLKRRMLKEEEEEVDVRGAAAENAESKGETRGPPSPQLVQCHRCKKLKRARSGKQGIDEEGDGHPAAEGAKHKVNEEEDDKVNLPKQLQKTIQDVAVIDSVSHLRADNEYKLVFEEYSVGPLLGKGGFGMVRAGTSKESSKPVAIKFVQLPTKNEWIHLDGRLLIGKRRSTRWGASDGSRRGTKQRGESLPP